MVKRLGALIFLVSFSVLDAAAVRIPPMLKHTLNPILVVLTHPYRPVPKNLLVRIQSPEHRRVIALASKKDPVLLSHEEKLKRIISRLKNYLYKQDPHIGAAIVFNRDLPALLTLLVTNPARRNSLLPSSFYKKLRREINMLKERFSIAPSLAEKEEYAIVSEMVEDAITALVEMEKLEQEFENEKYKKDNGTELR